MNSVERWKEILRQWKTGSPRGREQDLRLRAEGTASIFPNCLPGPFWGHVANPAR